MTASLHAAYTFLPWIQSGIGRSITDADNLNAQLKDRTTLTVTLQVDGASDVPAQAGPLPAARCQVRLYGPGDVTGLDPAQIVRCDPPAGTTQFEAGYMPQIQFARADLPWLFTPAAPGNSKTRLRPWLVLVAVRRQQGVALVPNPGGPLPLLELADPAAELPDLSQSWAWAHAQVTGLGAGVRPSDVLLSEPGRGCSRLLCPRRLEPNTAYLACLVPAFLSGVKAGRGDPVTEADETSAEHANLEPAWSSSLGGPPLRLPVYHAWEFTTASVRSFETLARRLHASPLNATPAPPLKLDLSAPGAGLPAAGAIGLQSALRVPGPEEPPEWPEATRVPFQRALEKGLTGAGPGVLAPPLYGQPQTAATALPPADGPQAWLREVNLDPRLRVAAAAGTRVVQERQEQLMARAWKQAGAAKEANAVLRRAQLAREVGSVLVERHFKPLAPADLLDMTQPAHAQIQLGPATVAGELHASRVPAAVVSGAVRRIASPQGVVARRARQARRIDMVAAVDQVAMKPAAAAPGGMVGMASFAAAPPPPDGRSAFSPDKEQLLERVAPDKTVLARTRSRIQAPAGTWTRPDSLAQVETEPRFAEPMYEALQKVAPALFFPGVERVEADGVALLETTPRMIEAFMVGLNHELSRELLWREFPAPLTGTAFRQFWDVSGQPGDPEALADIPRISEWAGAPLGKHLRRSESQLVLLVRGELLRRYPTTTIYAAPATDSDALDTKTRLAPMFRGTLPPDMVFLGFDLSEEKALGIAPAGRGWYFVFEERPGEPRFGLDEVGPETPTNVDELAWAHVPLTASGHIDVLQPLPFAGDPQALNAAKLAQLTFQRPFRVALHASRLLPKVKS